ncbi:hypothetical protein [Sulfurimonas paralvinellae]|uniref:Uncharacterized protein n=1 Tax=Sulfurimonas paralvinellae TaxID=317658 RepID=A0A7M1B4X9_9BACT|nr:hypothetical protein [Sulfurimonas paralvinellae]QOP44797.1 hypothetical protein FM071_00155 [Sulfurimonas paralvinellae]
MADDAATTDTTSNSSTTTTTTSTSTSTSVDSQIAAIQAAPAGERVQMMNEFKQRLANMNQEDRMAAIAAMQEKMQGKASAFGSTTREQAQGAKDQGAAMGQETSARAQEMAQEKQMQANEQMSQMQNMNQMRTGNQFMNMPANAPASSMPMSGGATGGSNFNMNMGQ